MGAFAVSRLAVGFRLAYIRLNRGPPLPHSGGGGRPRVHHRKSSRPRPGGMRCEASAERARSAAERLGVGDQSPAKLIAPPTIGGSSLGSPRWEAQHCEALSRRAVSAVNSSTVTG